MPITALDTWVFTLEELMLVSVTVWAVVAIVRVRRTDGFKWVQLLILLVILADTGDFLFNYFYYRLNNN